METWGNLASTLQNCRVLFSVAPRLYCVLCALETQFLDIDRNARFLRGLTKLLIVVGE